MVYFLHFLGGNCGMEITVLLLLTVPLTAASPLQPTHRSDANTVISEETVQVSEGKRSEDAWEERAPALKIVPFHSEDNRPGLDTLRHNFLTGSVAVKFRPRRANQRGCHLGTCQLHNLANTLFIFNKNGKDHSERASDPHGYGK